MSVYVLFVPKFSITQFVCYVIVCGSGNGLTLKAVPFKEDCDIPFAATVRELKHFVRRQFERNGKVIPPPPSEPWTPLKAVQEEEKKILYTDIPHVWTCGNKMIRLTDPDHKRNFIAFQVLLIFYLEKNPCYGFIFSKCDKNLSLKNVINQGHGRCPIDR